MNTYDVRTTALRAAQDCAGASDAATLLENAAKIEAWLLGGKAGADPRAQRSPSDASEGVDSNATAAG